VGWRCAVVVDTEDARDQIGQGPKRPFCVAADVGEFRSCPGSASTELVTPHATVERRPLTIEGERVLTGEQDWIVRPVVGDCTLEPERAVRQNRVFYADALDVAGSIKSSL
jgi:hypothetical protein